MDQTGDDDCGNAETKDPMIAQGLPGRVFTLPTPSQQIVEEDRWYSEIHYPDELVKGKSFMQRADAFLCQTDIKEKVTV